MRSVLQYYTWRFTDQLTPEEKQILARLSDNVYRLVRAAFEIAQDQLSPPDGLLPGYEDHSGFRTRVRRNEPALKSLSDQELDVMLDAVRRLGPDGYAYEEALAVLEKHLATGEYVERPDDNDVLRRAYAMVVNGLAWAFLYYKFGKIPPTTPLAELFSSAELELTGGDPTIPVGDILPRETLVHACRDSWTRATDLVDLLGVLSEMRIGNDLHGPKPAVENVVARLFEILCDLISTHRAFMPGSVPRRSRNLEDFRREFKTPMDAEIRGFLSPPGNPNVAPLTSDNLKSGWKVAGYADFTPRENRNFKLIHQMHWNWCRRAESPNQR